METTKPAATVAQPDAARTTLFRNVYLWMTMALTLTALTAYSVAGSQTLLQAIFSSKFIFYGLLISEIVLVLVLVANIMRMSFLTATLAFIAYSVLNGATLSVIFLIYDLGSIGTTFLVTAGMFGAMSLYGYVTGRDLSTWGNLLTMALVGILIASLANLFLKQKLNPMIGACGISAFPMSGRVVAKMALKEDPSNFIIQHAMGVNVAGQVASVVAGGLVLALIPVLS